MFYRKEQRLGQLDASEQGQWGPLRTCTRTRSSYATCSLARRSAIMCVAIWISVFSCTDPGPYASRSSCGPISTVSNKTGFASPLNLRSQGPQNMCQATNRVCSSRRLQKAHSPSLRVPSTAGCCDSRPGGRCA